VVAAEGEIGKRQKRMTQKRSMRGTVEDILAFTGLNNLELQMEP
jgi:hypothetical protein